jgi:hypothetical protein
MRDRGEAFDVTLDLYIATWRKSGLIEHRGPGPDQFHFAKIDLDQPWQEGNVCICTNRETVTALAEHYWQSLSPEEAYRRKAQLHANRRLDHQPEHWEQSDPVRAAVRAERRRAKREAQREAIWAASKSPERRAREQAELEADIRQARLNLQLALAAPPPPPPTPPPRGQSLHHVYMDIKQHARINGIAFKLSWLEFQRRCVGRINLEGAHQFERKPDGYQIGPLFIADPVKVSQ